MGKSKKKLQPLSDSHLAKKYGEGIQEDFDRALDGMLKEPPVKYKAKKVKYQGLVHSNISLPKIK